MKRCRALLLVGSMLPALLIATPPAAAASHDRGDRFVEIAVPGAVETDAMWINGEGAVTGFYWNEGIYPNYSRGFVYHDGHYRTFGLADTWLQPKAITDDGIVAGDAYDTRAQHGFVQRAGRTTLFDPPGSTHTIVVAINDAGTVAGNYFLDQGRQYGFLRSRDGTIVTLSFPNAITTWVNAINDKGAVTGYYNDREGNSYAFVYQRGTYTDLGLAPIGHTGGAAINDRGAIAGYAVVVGEGMHGFVLDHGTLTTLTMPGVSNLQPAGRQGIDNAGRIVGTYGDEPAARAFLYRSGAFTTVLPPGAQMSSAMGINDAGTMIGYFWAADGVHSFLYRSSGHHSD